MSVQHNICPLELHLFQSLTKTDDTVQFYLILVLINGGPKILFCLGETVAICPVHIDAGQKLHFNSY